MSGVPRFARREPESTAIQGSQLGLDDGTTRDEVRLVHDQFASTRAARLSERLRRRGSTKGGMRRSFSPGHGARKPPGVRKVGPEAWGGCRRISSRWPGKPWSLIGRWWGPRTTGHEQRVTVPSLYRGRTLMLNQRQTGSVTICSWWRSSGGPLLSCVAGRTLLVKRELLTSGQASTMACNHSRSPLLSRSSRAQGHATEARCDPIDSEGRPGCLRP